MCCSRHLVCSADPDRGAANASGRNDACLSFGCAFSAASCFFAAVSDHAFLPTMERLAVVAERSEVGVLNTSEVSEGEPTLSEGV